MDLISLKEKGVFLAFWIVPRKVEMNPGFLIFMLGNFTATMAKS